MSETKPTIQANDETPPGENGRASVPFSHLRMEIPAIDAATTAADRLRDAMGPVDRMAEQCRRMHEHSGQAFRPIQDEIDRIQDIANPATEAIERAREATRPMREAIEKRQLELQDVFSSRPRLESALSDLQSDHDRLGTILDTPPRRELPDFPFIPENPIHETNRRLQTVAEVGQNQAQHLAAIEKMLVADRKVREQKAGVDQRVQRRTLWLQLVTLGLIAAGLILKILSG